jgi:TetR/AcrR family transcriptional regulator, cholesterol catabolism regulator
MARPKKVLSSNKATNLLEPDIETHERILKAATAQLAARGYKGMSMRDVADAVEVTPAALYYHYPSKDDIFVDVMRSIFDEWAKGVKQATDGVHDVREKLLKLTMYYLTRKDSGMVTLMRDVRTYLDHAKQELIWKYYAETYQKEVNQVFQYGIDSRQLSQNVPTHLLGTMYMGMINHFLFNPRTRAELADPVEAERIGMMVVSILLDGIRNRGQEMGDGR